MTDHSDLIERLRAACVGHPSASIAWPHRILHEAASALSSQSLSLSEAREEIERLKIRECPQEAPSVDVVRLAVAKAICLAMGDDWEREGPGDVLMEAYGPLADAALSATPQGSLPEHADAPPNPPLSDLSSLRKGAEEMRERAAQICEGARSVKGHAIEYDGMSFVKIDDVNAELNRRASEIRALVSGSREDGE